MATRPKQTDAERWERETFARLPERDAPFSTISGEPIRPLYTEGDLPADPEAAIGLPGEYPYTRGVYPSMYRGRLWTMRQFAGFGSARGDERPVPLPARARADRALDGVRHALADGPRLRPSAVARRGRARGRRGRHARGHGDAVRWDPARPGQRLDDDQRSGGDHARVLRGRRRAPGDRTRAARGHDPDGHPQGVHRPEGVVLPGRPGDAAGHRHDRVVHAAHAAVASDLDLRLPHPRGGIDRRAGAGVHAQGRAHVRRAGGRARPRASTSSRRG